MATNGYYDSPDATQDHFGGARPYLDDDPDSALVDAPPPGEPRPIGHPVGGSYTKLAELKDEAARRRSFAYAKPGPYKTTLPPEQEQHYQNWVKKNKIPWSDTPDSDYDMRGFYSAMMSGKLRRDPKTAHFPDTFKTPYHKSFSNESQYATADAPHWEGHRLIDKLGGIVHEEPGAEGELRAGSVPGDSRLPGEYPDSADAPKAKPWEGVPYAAGPDPQMPGEYAGYAGVPTLPRAARPAHASTAVRHSPAAPKAAPPDKLPQGRQHYVLNPSMSASMVSPVASHAVASRPVASHPVAGAINDTIGPAQERGWGRRLHDLIRNSPLGHAIQTEFPDHFEWFKPTTIPGSEDWEAEQKGLRFENLTEGLTQHEAEQAANFGLTKPMIPKGTFRKTTADADTPAEQRFTGAAKQVSELTSAPAAAQMVGIAAGIELAVPALAGSLAARLIKIDPAVSVEATEAFEALIQKTAHTLIGAGFTADMAHGVVKQFQQYREAKANGDDRTANQILGGLAVSGVLTVLGGAGTGTGAQHALKEIRRFGDYKSGVTPARVAAYRGQQEATRARDAQHIGKPTGQMVADITNSMSKDQMLEELGVKEHTADPRENLNESALAGLVAAQRMKTGERPAMQPKPPADAAHAAAPAPAPETPAAETPALVTEASAPADGAPATEQSAPVAEQAAAPVTEPKTPEADAPAPAAAAPPVEAPAAPASEAPAEAPAPAAAQTAAAPAGKPRKGAKKGPKVGDAAKLAAEHFTPGNVVYSRHWNSYDKVLQFQPGTQDTPWAVQVIHVNRDGSPIPGERPRWHATYPDKGDMVVGKAPAETAPPAAEAAPIPPFIEPPAPLTAPPPFTGDVRSPHRVEREAATAAQQEPLQPFVRVHEDGTRSQPQPMRQSDVDKLNAQGGNWEPLSAPSPDREDAGVSRTPVSAPAPASAPEPAAAPEATAPKPFNADEAARDYEAAAASSHEENAEHAGTPTRSDHRGVPVIGLIDHAMLAVDKVLQKVAEALGMNHDPSNGIVLQPKRAAMVAAKLREIAAGANQKTMDAMEALAKAIEEHQTENGNAILHRLNMSPEEQARVSGEEVFHDHQHANHLTTSENASAINARMLDPKNPSAEAWKTVADFLRRHGYDDEGVISIEIPAWAASSYNLEELGISQPQAVQLLADYFKAAEEVVGDHVTRKLPPMAKHLESEVKNAIKSKRAERIRRNLRGGSEGRVNNKDTQKTGEPAKAATPAAAPAAEVEPPAAKAPKPEPQRAATKNPVLKELQNITMAELQGKVNTSHRLAQEALDEGRHEDSKRLLDDQFYWQKKLKAAKEWEAQHAKPPEAAPAPPAAPPAAKAPAEKTPPPVAPAAKAPAAPAAAERGPIPINKIPGYKLPPGSPTTWEVAGTNLLIERQGTGPYEVKDGRNLIGTGKDWAEAEQIARKSLPEGHAAAAPVEEATLQSRLRRRTASGDDDEWLRQGAMEYVERQGHQFMPKSMAEADARAIDIADAYAEIKHEPNNPEVKASYGALKDDIDKQWDYATNEMGIHFEPWDKSGQPYQNSAEMIADVKDKQHLYFFRGGEMPSDHPMLGTDPKTGLTYNEKIRAVHDLFGHAVHGNQFGAHGEERAWIDHSNMFSPDAVPALTSETKGQNSWVNYGPHMRDAQGKLIAKGEQGWLHPNNRPYAEQKAGLLPKRFHYRTDAPKSFVSPNVYKLDSVTDAQRRTNSMVHKSFLNEAQALARAMNMRVTFETVIGSWQQGAEDSVMMHYPIGTDPELIHYYEANLGKLAYQNATARFIPHPEGPDSIYSFWVDGAKTNGETLAQSLLSNGIENSTIVEAPGGHTVILIDQGNLLRDKVDHAAEQLGVKSVERHAGKADFPGNYDSRDAAERDYASAIEEIESGRPSLGEIRRGWESRPGYDNLHKQIREGDRLAQQGVSPFTEAAHGSRTPNIVKVDPAYHGKGPMRGAEMKRAQKFPELFQPRSYYRIEGTHGEPFYEVQPHQYRALFNRENLYDFRADKDNLWKQIPDREHQRGAGFTYFEKLIKDAGYDGFYDSEQGEIQAFHATPVEAKLKAGEIKLPDAEESAPLQSMKPGIKSHFEGDNFDERRAAIMGAGNAYDPDSLMTGAELAQGMTAHNSYRDYPSQADYNRMASGHVGTDEILRTAPRRLNSDLGLEELKKEAARRMGGTTPAPSDAERNKAFDAIADQQRYHHDGDAEDAMLNVQYAAGGGVWPDALEHVGDLLHRMTERTGLKSGVNGSSEFGFGNVKDKVERKLWALQRDSSYMPFKQEFEQNLRNNYESRRKDGKYPASFSFDDFKQRVFDLGEKYAEEHEKLPVYNRVQEVARQAAIDLGRRDFKGAERALEELKGHLDQGKEHWQKVAGKYDPQYGERGDKPQAEQPTLQSLKRQTETPEFKNWFGGSKVVDEGGKPLRVYHGTGADFDEFKDANNRKYGFYFTESPEVADRYAPDQPGAKLIPAYLRMQNPTTYEHFMKVRQENRGKDTAQLLADQGFDGVITTRGHEFGSPGQDDRKTFIVFKPEQIKSAIGNRGTFDPESPNILQSRKAAETDPKRLMAEAEAHRPEGAESLQSRKAAGTPRGSTAPMMRSTLIGEKYDGLSAIAEHLENHTRRALQPLYPGKTPEEHRAMVTRAVRILGDELKYQLGEENNGTDWYKNDIRGGRESLMGYMKELHPELEKPVKEQMFLLLTAGTSPGKAAAFDNVDVAEQAYSLYKKTGRIPLTRENGSAWGTYGNAPLKSAQAVLRHFGGDEAKAMEWMLSKHSLAEVEEVKGKSGFRANTLRDALPPDYDPEQVYGAYVLGAKVGPFFLNLNGIATELTVDRWFMRTWNRAMGTLVGADEEIKDIPTGKHERAAMIDSIDKLKKEFGLETSQVQAALWYYEQGLYSRLGKKGTFGGTYANAARYVHELRTIRARSRGEAYGGQWEDAFREAARSIPEPKPAGVRGEDTGSKGKGSARAARAKASGDFDFGDTSFDFGEVNLQSRMKAIRAEARRRDPRLQP